MQLLKNEPLEARKNLALLQTGTALLDVRAPQEFAKGCLPNSTNLPILNDAERQAVGTMYKQQGSEAAKALGHELVSGSVKSSRVNKWKDYLDREPGARVMCWRGGQRSQIAQQWLADQGHSVERVPGGYKALRQLCIRVLDTAAHSQQPWWVVAGRTGVQKTVLIRKVPTAIDLEGLAHHRGSAFGGYADEQPTPATFENTLAVAYLQHNQPILVLEDESRTIGRLALPEAWHGRMQTAPLVLLEASLPERVAHIVQEYVTDTLEREDSNVVAARYRDALRRISRRLGGVTHQHIDKLVTHAFAGQISHEAWVEALLCRYYDPMYDYQLAKKQSRIEFRGTMAEVQAFLAELTSHAHEQADDRDHDHVDAAQTQTP